MSSTAPVRTERERVNRALRVTPVQLEAAIRGFRNIFKALREENPHWTQEETLRYVYENDDDFKAFYDKQPSACRMIMDEKNTDEKLEKFLSLFTKQDRGEVTPQQVARALLRGL